MRRFLIFAMALPAVVYSTDIQASPRDAFGLDAPNVARAMAVTAAAPPVSAASVNPALLINMSPDSIEMMANLVVSDDSLKINRADAGLDTYVGYQLELAAALPLGEWRDRLFVGATAHLPHAGLYQTHTPTIEEPIVYRDGTDARHFSVDAGLAVRIWHRIALGAGFHLTPTTEGNAHISFANHKESSSTNIKVKSRFAPIVGIYAEPIDHLHLGVVYRAATRFSMDIIADIFINDAIGYIHTQLKSYAFIEPHSLSFGARYDFSELAPDPLARFAVNLDVEWMHYDSPIATTSQVWLYDDGGEIINDPDEQYDSFEEAFSVRTALDWMPLDELTVSVGYGFWKTPIPVQRRSFNVLDASFHEIAFGASYWLPPNTLNSFDLGFSMAMKADVFQKREMEKYEYLPDNPGFPHITFEGNAYTCHFGVMMRFK